MFCTSNAAKNNSLVEYGANYYCKEMVKIVKRCFLTNKNGIIDPFIKCRFWLIYFLGRLQNHSTIIDLQSSRHHVSARFLKLFNFVMTIIYFSWPAEVRTFVDCFFFLSVNVNFSFDSMYSYRTQCLLKLKLR